MKLNLYKRLVFVALALLLVAAAWPVGVKAASGIYVNDSQNTLSGDLNKAYVIGADGTVTRLTDTHAYVVSERGVEMIGYTDTVIPPHLSVGGSVSIKYSKIRVGLYYFDSASSIRNPTLDSANLENAVGNGYKFGYYDSSRIFHELGYTTQKAITMASDKNHDLSGGHLGCYHILLPNTYQSFEAAKTAADQYSDGFPAYYDGVYRTLVGNYDSAQAASDAATARSISGTAYSASNKCVVVTRTSDSAILFEFDGGSSKSLAVSPQNSSGKAITWFKGYKYYGDFEYVRRTGDKLTVINAIDIEDYVKGILPYEMSSNWPIEALKAQAVCARTFAVNNFNANSSYGFDVTNDTFSQAYRGTNLANANSDSAVDATAGQYITYNGRLISALYSSSFGGGSENSENVFTNTLPYLRGKLDPFEAASDSINGKSSWTFRYTKGELTTFVNRVGHSLSTIKSLEVTYSDTGNAIGLKFTDVNGRVATITKGACQSFCTGTMGMYSIHFTAVDNGSSITFNGGGWGHSCGMSQFGAYAMARSYGYTYDQIIGFYYTGVALSRGA